MVFGNLCRIGPLPGITTTCSMDSLPASQVEAIAVEILLSSQGSRKVNVEKSSIVYSFLVRAHNLQILRIEQGSTPRID
jgi:hypothetical protein